MIDARLSSELLKSMVRIRCFEDKVDESIRAGVIPAPTHSYVGEEAIAAGVCAGLQPDDYVVSSHRNHGHCLAKGMEPWRIVAEMMGREGAYCQGLGGDNHLGDVSKHMLGGNNIVGGGMPLAIGSAYVQKYRSTGLIVACFFGDGAVNQGLFHESLNLAVVIGVPVLFVLENNHYAISTRVESVSAALPAAEFVKSYGMQTERADGNDVEDVYERSARLVERVRAESKPAFLECDTYRLGPHWTGEWGGYRAREEVESRRGQEPVKRWADKLLKDGVMKEEDVDRLWGEARQEMEDAVARVKEEPALRPEVLLEVHA